MDPVLANLIAIALLLTLAMAAAALLRQAGTPGSAIIGGALAGILLGPTIFGRTLPATYEHLVIGGVEQREELEQVLRRHHADLLAAEEAGMNPEAVDDVRRRHHDEVEQHRLALDQARWEYQRPMRILTAAVAGLALFIGGLKRADAGGGVRSWSSAVSVGMWAAALPGTLAFLAMRWWWEHDLHSSALVAAAVMIGPWMLTSIDRKAADDAELGGAWMIQTAGRIATIIAIAVIGWALAAGHGVEIALWASVLLALPSGWIVGRMAPASAGMDARKSNGVETLDGLPGQGRGYAGLVAQRVLIPALAACAAVRIEVIEHFAFWPLLVMLLLSGDGRWLGAVVGALLLGGRSGLRTMRLVLGSMACGPTQLAVLAIAVQLWVMPDELPLALIIGAIVIDATAPARRKIAQQLAEAEVELSDETDETDDR